MDEYSVTLYGIDTYTKYQTALTYNLEAPDAGAAVDLARLAASRSYPEFKENYEVYTERMGKE